MDSNDVRNQLIPFQYAQLKPDQIRLMTIQPSASREEPLVISLTAYDIDSNRLRWDAISYHHGNKHPNYTIRIDGKSLDITASAYHALLHSRRPYQPRIIWIDQICINQRDEEEKFQQIIIMSRIFKEAQLVVVYLGESWAGLVSFFDFLNALDYLPNVFTLERWLPWTTIPEQHPLAQMFYPVRKLPSYTWKRLSLLKFDIDTLKDAQDRLFQSPWFCRCWTVQEVTLAQKVQIQCSNLVASWESLLISRNRYFYSLKAPMPVSLANGLRCASSMDLIRVRGPGRTPSLKLVWNEFVYDMKLKRYFEYPRLALFNAKRLWTREYPDLLSVLRHCRWQDVTDLRDKIFGFLGLADPTFVSALVPQTNDLDKHYKRNISGASWALAVAHIVKTQTLDVLMATCMNASVHADLPFWIPDWSQEPPPCDTEWRFPLKTIPHQAGTQYPAQPRLMPSEKALVLRGVLLDVVEDVAEHRFELGDLHDTSRPVWKAWQSFATNPVSNHDPYIDASGRNEAYWRTLIYDADNTGRRATSNLIQDVIDWAQESSIPQTSKTKNCSGLIAFKSRSLFRTKRGYLGNACVNVQPGDVVAVLMGGRLPFVLRADRDVEGAVYDCSTSLWDPEARRLKGYKLVGGDAYVHGLCEGQAWNIANMNNISIQQIALV